MSARDDRRFMRVALREAARGRPSPSAYVGAIVVARREVVATAFADAGVADSPVHRALASAGDAARGATLYATLEPRDALDAIVRAAVARVVIGARIDGATARLEASGIEVVHGVCAADATRLVADAMKFAATHRPFVMVKAALTLDGKMCTSGGDSKWITGERARRHVHRMRERSDAVLVGVGTVLADDPELTVRHVPGVHPLRIVVDTSLRTPETAKVCDTGTAPTIIFHGPGVDASRVAALEARGVELVEVARSCGSADLGAVLDALGARGVMRLMVEGGPRLIDAMMQRDLVDRIAAFVAPVILGEASAPGISAGRTALRMSDALRLHAVRTRRFGDDVLIEGDVRPLDHERPHGYACDQS